MVETKDRAACARYMAKLELFSLIEKFGLDEVPAAEEMTEDDRENALKIEEC